MRVDQLFVLIAAVCFLIAAMAAVANTELPGTLSLVYMAMFVANYGFSQL